MKAAVLDRPGAPFRIEDVDLAPPRAGEVLVSVAAAGVCRSDLHVRTGATAHPMPVVCGHEASGVVREVGAGVVRVRPGQRVVLSWAPSCGGCFFCVRGLPAQCETYIRAIWSGTLMDGTPRLSLGGYPVFHFCALATFAEATVVHESSCIPLPDGVPLDAAALVGCAVTTGVGAALLRARVTAGSTVAVFGCGGVGVNIVQGAALARAARVVAVDPNPSRIELARRLGATDGVDPSTMDPVQMIRDLTGGRGADYTFEAIGRPAVMAQAIEAARRGGTIVLVGLGGQGESVALGADTFTRSDKALTSAYYGGCDPSRDMPMILDLCASGRVKLQELIGHRRPLAQINEAFEGLEGSGELRTLITFAAGGG